MRVIGRLLIALAVMLPLTCIFVAGTASAEGGFGPAVLKCGFWQDGMNISPGIGNNPSGQTIQAHGRVSGCNKAGGGAQFTATLQMGGATCSNLSMQGEAQFEWANGSHSTAFLTFDPLSGSPRKMTVGGSITSGTFQGTIVLSQLRFTQIYSGSGDPCSPGNLLQKMEFTNSRSLQLLSPSITPTTQSPPPPTTPPTNGPPPTSPVTDQGTVPNTNPMRRVVIVERTREVVVVRRRRPAVVIVQRRFPTGTLAFTGSSTGAAVVGLGALLVGGVLAWGDPDRGQGFARFRKRTRKSLHVTLPPR